MVTKAIDLSDPRVAFRVEEAFALIGACAEIATDNDVKCSVAESLTENEAECLLDVLEIPHESEADAERQLNKLELSPKSKADADTRKRAYSDCAAVVLAYRQATEDADVNASHVRAILTQIVKHTQKLTSLLSENPLAEAAGVIGDMTLANAASKAARIARMALEDAALQVMVTETVKPRRFRLFPNLERSILAGAVQAGAARRRGIAGAGRAIGVTDVPGLDTVVSNGPLNKKSEQAGKLRKLAETVQRGMEDAPRAIFGKNMQGTVDEVFEISQAMSSVIDLPGGLPGMLAASADLALGRLPEGKKAGTLIGPPPKLVLALGCVELLDAWRPGAKLTRDINSPIADLAELLHVATARLTGAKGAKQNADLSSAIDHALKICGRRRLFAFQGIRPPLPPSEPHPEFDPNDHASVQRGGTLVPGQEFGDEQPMPGFIGHIEDSGNDVFDVDEEPATPR